MKYLKRFNESSKIPVNRTIDQLCRQYDIRNYKINPDGTVDVEGDVNLSRKNLTKLPFQFGQVSGDFSCIANKLTSLEGAPKEVGGYVDCSRNLLTSLEGAPKEVGGGFYCYNNILTSLEGAPKRVGGGFDCDCNQIHSFLGLEIGVNFTCYNNPIEAIWKIFKGVRPHTPNKFPQFLDKINHIYTDFQLGDGWTIQGEVLEQITEELEVQLPTNWESQLVKAGYTII